MIDIWNTVVFQGNVEEKKERMNGVRTIAKLNNFCKTKENFCHKIMSFNIFWTNFENKEFLQNKRKMLPEDKVIIYFRQILENINMLIIFGYNLHLNT